MELKPGYKQTEVGVIPEDWHSPQIRTVCRLINGRGFKPHEWRTSGLPIVRIQNLNGSDEFNNYSGQFNSKILIEKDQLLFAWSGSRGTSFGPHIWRGERALLNYHTWKVVVDETEIRQDYLYFALRHLTAKIEDAAHGASALVHTQKGEMEQFQIAVPLTEVEQRAIATALSDVDALLNALDRLIAKKRYLKQAAMQQLLTGQTRLPGFSGEWEVKTVAELEKLKLVKLSRGQVISKKDIVNTPGDFPIYSSSIHNDGLFGRYGDFMFDEELITWSVDGGGNFFHRRKHKFSVTNVCGFMRVDTSRIDYRFFAAELQLLHSRKSFDYQSKAHPSVIRKEYEVQLPELPEQTAIAAVFSDMDAEIEALEARRAKTRDLKQAMMQELLTGRTRLV